MTAEEHASEIRVVIADDHAVVRRGTREILEHGGTDIHVVGEAADGAAAVELVDALLPDVAILDIGMPGISGVEATRLIKTRHPSVSVLILTVQNVDEYVWQAVRAGASGYLLKDVSDADLVYAVRTVAGGGGLIDPAVTPALLTRLQRKDQPASANQDLSSRELEVLRLAARGLSNRRIAELLDLSPRTIEVHMSNIFGKVGAGSRTEAVFIASRRGLIDLENES